MEYIIDLDCLKNCIDLLPVKMRINEERLIDINDVKSLIDNFPKKEVKSINE